MGATVYGGYIDRLKEHVGIQYGKSAQSELERKLAEEYPGRKFVGSNPCPVECFDYALNAIADLAENGKTKEEIWRTAGKRIYHNIFNDKYRNTGKVQIKDLLDEEAREFPKHHSQGKLEANPSQMTNDYVIKIVGFPMSESYRHFAIGYLRELGRKGGLEKCAVTEKAAAGENVYKFIISPKSKGE